MARAVRALADRLWERVDADGPCWLWTGPIDPNGYGRIHFSGRNLYVHRAVYELLVGSIPDGLECDHVCRVRRCCNPDHVEPVTHAENSGRSPIMGAPTSTHCKRGHPFDDANTRITGKGRVCRACARLMKKQRAINLKGSLICQ